jgi:DNA mismatch repair ATPase MutS
LYQLVNGKAEKSFGLNVAQLVGLPKELINAARLKSDEMHEEI